MLASSLYNISNIVLQLSSKLELLYAIMFYCTRLVRGLIIDMVLATDMSCHFEQIKIMKNLLSSPEA